MAVEVKEKKNKNKRYEPVLEGIPDWPVYQLSKNRKEFVEEVANQSLLRIKELRHTRKQLIDELEATVYREQQRLKRNRWRVDPQDEPKFWASIKSELVEITAKPLDETGNTANNNKEDEILKRIVQRYANEISGKFNPSSYKFARSIIKFWFSRLLNAARVKKFGAIFRNQYTLRDVIEKIEAA